MLPAANADPQSALFTVSGATNAARVAPSTGAEAPKREGPSFGTVLARLAAQGSRGEKSTDSESKSLTTNEESEAALAEDDSADPVEGNKADTAGGEGAEADSGAARTPAPGSEGEPAENAGAEGSDSADQADDSDGLSDQSTPFTGYRDFLSLTEQTDAAGPVQTPLPANAKSDSQDASEAASVTPAVAGTGTPVPGQDHAGSAGKTHEGVAKIAASGQKDEASVATVAGGRTEAASNRAVDGPRLPAADAMFQGRFSLMTEPHGRALADPAAQSMPTAETASTGAATPAAVVNTRLAGAEVPTTVANTLTGANATTGSPATPASGGARQAGAQAGETQTPANPASAATTGLRPDPATGSVAAAAATRANPDPAPATSQRSALVVEGATSLSKGEGQRLEVSPELRARVTLTGDTAGQTRPMGDPAKAASAVAIMASPHSAPASRDPSQARGQAYLAIRAMASGAQSSGAASPATPASGSMSAGIVAAGTVPTDAKAAGVSVTGTQTAPVQNPGQIAGQNPAGTPLPNGTNPRVDLATGQNTPQPQDRTAAQSAVPAQPLGAQPGAQMTASAAPQDAPLAPAQPALAAAVAGAAQGAERRGPGGATELRGPRERLRDAAPESATKPQTILAQANPNAVTSAAANAQAGNGGLAGDGSGDKAMTGGLGEAEALGDRPAIDGERGGFESLLRSEQAQRNDPAQARQANAPETARQVASQIGAHLDGPDAVRSANGGFDLRLDPDELGQIRLRLVHHDGASTLFVQADRPETMDLMRRHIAALEQDLRAMGHTNLSLQFSGNGLQGQGWTGAQQQQNGQSGSAGASVLTRAADQPEGPRSAPSLNPQRLGARDSLDLRL